jgi:hypothetical protein
MTTVSLYLQAGQTVVFDCENFSISRARDRSLKSYAFSDAAWPSRRLEYLPTVDQIVAIVVDDRPPAEVAAPSPSKTTHNNLTPCGDCVGCETAAECER